MNRITNELISNFYKKNYGLSDHIWMNDLFLNVKFFAEKKANRLKFNREEVKQEAYLGLWKAIISFDFSKNFDFFRWADWHISSRIRDYISAQSRERLIKRSAKEIAHSVSAFPPYGSAPIDSRIDVEKWLSIRSRSVSVRDKKIIVDTIFVNKTLSEVAAENSISIERVRQIKKENKKDLICFFADSIT
jgi:RNA polymerase sigma factor (sigma-70 family)